MMKTKVSDYLEKVDEPIQRVINKPYLSAGDIPNSDFVFVKAECGTNKTGSMLNKIASQRFERFVCITSHRRTIRSIAERWGDEVLVYEDSKSPDEIYKAKYLIITLNSLPKIVRDGHIKHIKETIVWVDEYTQVMKTFIAETVDRNRYQVMNTFESLMRFCKKAYFTCADLKDENIRLTTDYIKRPHKVLINTHTNHKHDWEIVHDIDDYRKRLLKDIKQGRNVVIPTDTGVDYSCALGKYLVEHSDLTDDDVLVVNKGNSKDEKAKENLDNITKFRVFIYSPSLLVGYNMDLGHFDTLRALFCGKSIDADGANQLIRRVRQFKTKKATIYLHKVTKTKVLTDHEAIKHVYQAMVKEQREGLHPRFLYCDENDVPVANDWMTSICAYAKLEQNRSKRNFEELLIERLKTAGDKVVKVKESRTTKKNKTSKEITGLKHKHCEEELMEIVKTAPLTSEQADTIQSMSLRTEEEQRQLDRFIIFDKQLEIKLTDENANGVLKTLQEKGGIRRWYPKVKHHLEYLTRRSMGQGDIIQKTNKRHELLQTLVKRCGWESIYDQRVIKMGKDLEISKKERKTIEVLFTITQEEINAKRSRGKKQKNPNIDLLGRLLDAFFDVRLNKERKRVRDGGQRVYHYLYQLNHCLPLAKVLTPTLSVVTVKLKEANDIVNEAIKQNYIKLIKGEPFNQCYDDIKEGMDEFLLTDKGLKRYLEMNGMVDYQKQDAFALDESD